MGNSKGKLTPFSIRAVISHSHAQEHERAMTPTRGTQALALTDGSEFGQGR